MEKCGAFPSITCPTGANITARRAASRGRRPASQARRAASLIQMFLFNRQQLIPQQPDLPPQLMVSRFPPLLAEDFPQQPPQLPVRQPAECRHQPLTLDQFPNDRVPPQLPPGRLPIHTFSPFSPDVPIIPPVLCTVNSICGLYPIKNHASAIIISERIHRGWHLAVW